MSWNSIIGQQRVKEILRLALRSGRMPHACLFVGPQGVGKDAAALELARILHCEQPDDGSCGICDSCRRIEAFQHPDVHWVTALPRGKDETNEHDPLERLPEGDVHIIQEQFREKGKNPYHRIEIPRANVIKVNSIRNVRRLTVMTTSDGKPRVTVISNADLMNDEAANMLLKTLEEPADNNLLILTTSHREQLLPTILSRCQLIRFDVLNAEDIAAALVVRCGVAPEQAEITARVADGSYSRAVDLLSEDLLQMRRDAVQFVRHALGSGTTGILGDIDRIAELKDKSAAARFLQLLLLWFRDAMMLANGGTAINQDQQEDIQRFVSRFPSADFARALRGTERALSLLDRNIHIRLLLINISLLYKAAAMGDSAVGDPNALAAGESL